MSATAVKSDNLLEVRDLRVVYRDEGRFVPIVDGVSFSLRRGEALGLAGESGCGKTTTALALLGLLPSGLGRTRGEITLNSTRGVMLLHRRTPTGWRDVRWRTVSMVFQGAMNALDPVMRIDRQIAEAIRLHEPGADPDARVERAARARRHPQGAPPAVPARVLRRDAAARDDRARAGLRARADHRRRADDGARRDDAGSDPAAARGAAPRPRPGAAPDHARSLGASPRPATASRSCTRVRSPSSPRSPTSSRRRSTRTPSACSRAFAHVGGPRSLGEAIPGAPPNPGEEFPGCRFAPRCHLAFADCVKGPVPLLVDHTGREARCLLAKLAVSADAALRGPRAPRHVPARAPSAGASRRRRRPRTGDAARRSGSSASRAAASRRSRAPCSGSSTPSAGSITFDGKPVDERPARAAPPRAADLPGPVPVAQSPPHRRRAGPGGARRDRHARRARSASSAASPRCTTRASRRPTASGAATRTSSRAASASAS